MLIVDKPMPTNCYDCALDCCWDEGTIPVEYAEKRKLNCPIKGELPDEHGDLIDRQDAIKEFEPYAEYESNRRNADWVKRIKAVLNNMTAIIAAERKDDEQIH